MGDFNGYANWGSREFSLTWSNDQDMYRSVLERARATFASHLDDPERLGASIVEYVRENYTGTGEGANDWRFKDMSDEDWDEIDRTEVGAEVLDALGVESE